VLDVTVCERGDEAPALPEIRSISKSMLSAELLEKVMAQNNSGYAAWDAALQALHLLPLGMSSLEADVAATVDAIAAYYDPDSQSITIIEGASDDDATRMYVLSHELTHYLQDLKHPLNAFLDEHGHSTDQQISLRSLIEGEAVVNSTRVLVRMMHHGPEDLLWNMFFSSLDESSLRSIELAAAPLSAAALNLPYSIGGRYVARVWANYDREHVEALFETPALALVDWLAGYGEEMPKPSLLEPLDCAPPLAPEGFALEALDTLGVTGAVALITAAGGRPDLKLPQDLRADALAVYVRSGEEPTLDTTLVFWRLRFRTDAAATAFAARLATLSDLSVRRFGRELALRVGPEVAPDAIASCPELAELMPAQPSIAIGSRRSGPAHMPDVALRRLRR
jgi:hypothetical protein